MKARTVLVPLLLSCGLLSAVQAQEAERAATPPGQETAWAPPVPSEDGFDWIQLKSGEWLKGRLKALQEEELEFDSEELDDLTFDWEDVIQVRSARLQDLLFDDGVKASGPVTITTEEVMVGGKRPRTFLRRNLQSITPGGSRLNYWSGDISLGITLRSGNSSESVYNAGVSLQRRTPATRLTLDYLGYLSRLEGSETANNHRLSTEFDRWLSKRFYLVVPFAEFFRDPFQNIKNRYTLGAGVGYDLIDTNHLEWSVKALPAYQSSEFESTQPGEDESMQAAAFVAISDTDWEITERLDLLLGYQGQLTNKENGGLHSHLTSNLEFEFTEIIELDIGFVWDRVSEPQPDSNGVIPEKDDFRLIIGFSAEF